MFLRLGFRSLGCRGLGFRLFRILGPKGFGVSAAVFDLDVGL